MWFLPLIAPHTSYIRAKMCNLSRSAPGCGLGTRAGSGETPASFRVVVVRTYQAFFTPHFHARARTHTHPLPLPTLPPDSTHTICQRRRMQWNISRELARTGGHILPINHARELMRGHKQNKCMEAAYFPSNEPDYVWGYPGSAWLSWRSRDVEVEPPREDG